MARVTPLDIIQREFNFHRRGFDPDEVRAFLEEIRETLEATLKERRHLEEAVRAKDLELERMRRNEDQIKDTLVLARKLSEELEENARREADLVVGEAQLEAQRILAASHDEHRALLGEVQQLKGAKYKVLAEMRAVLDSHGRLLQDMERDLQPHSDVG